MNAHLLTWDIYEITTESSTIHGVKLRGRIRKICLEHNQNVLAENATDAEMMVRFAVPAEEDPSIVTNYLHKILPEVTVTKAKDGVMNPVLSKLNVNLVERYTI